MTEVDFEKLKDEHERAVKMAAEARGVLLGIQNRLKQEYGIESVRDAKKRMQELDRDLARLRREFEAKVDAYRKEFDK